MIHQPTRRDLLRYALAGSAGIAAARAQVRIPGPGGKGASATRSLYTLVSQTTGGAGLGAASPKSTAAINTTGAKLLILGMGFAGAAAPMSVADFINGSPSGNTWTALTIQASAGSAAQIWYCANALVGTNHIVTISGTSGSIFLSAVFAAFAGGLGFDTGKSSGAVFNSNITGSPQAGPLTPSLADSLVIAACSTSNPGGPVDAGTDTVLLDNSGLVGGTSYGVGVTYRIQVGAAYGMNPSWNVGGGGSTGGVVLACFS